jgi:hypothetical protein
MFNPPFRGANFAYVAASLLHIADDLLCLLAHEGSGQEQLHCILKPDAAAKKKKKKKKKGKTRSESAANKWMASMNPH